MLEIVEQLLFQIMEKFQHRQKVIKNYLFFKKFLFFLDHKPSVRKEEERIIQAGGRVTKYTNDVARVENLLAVSRTLGDYSLDKHLIPAQPDIIQYSRQSSAAFIILACDGIWDVMNNEQVASFVYKRISNTSLQDIVSQLLDECFKLETQDNMSIYIIKL